MQFPLTVIDQLDEEQLQKWHDFYGLTADRPRYQEEGIWRRTQQEETADNSGWTGSGDARRRIIHYRHQFGLVDTTGAPALAMTELYVYHSVAAPHDEIHEAWEQNHLMLAEGGWKETGPGRWELGDLRLHTSRIEEHPEDVRAGRKLPAGYQVIDTTFTSVNCFLPKAIRRRPWEVLTHGVRVKDTPGKPIYADNLAQLTDFLPFQVEVGCGVSYEAGIPPLHRLHEIYRVNEIEDIELGKGTTFILAPGRDPFLQELLLNTEDKVLELSEMYQSCFNAEVTPALHALKRLETAGHMVGPFITNNFDALGARAGFREEFMRRYDQRIPPVTLHPEAKALVVIGLHADRRQVARRAREAGLKVFIVDPEGFPRPDGTWFDYPLEGPQDGDVVVRQTAATAIGELERLLEHGTDSE
ncbi:hypothetical protein Snoj_27950 [Streptomyces nojiriensis]|uniref:Deacetylase sirtuin-type domain-containing protein n=1 Tax=Streptomyces nojiriensis TaxID=66374 RepID=A0ABQ3SL66_9ACTN|nr:hypothetical protein [Streptomyces nojiriensis]QTI42476.1 hypothetical protein JYK04_00234 [Streptomyces nojiriensis]GGS38139.1 hypothetical protein GCM10010205_79920 [Streptomyces nojiriensis]GHI68877.1 hypothetical protein Snoj_27950 [Streptomyces nojiriensis]